MFLYGLEISQRIIAKPQIRLVLAPSNVMKAIGANPTECHENCRKWIIAHPKDSVIRGFLFNSAASVVKHSAIRTADGVALDVTPRLNDDGANMLTFAEWPWTDEQFAEVPNEAGLTLDQFSN